jgi:hypothetical protein
VFRSIDTTVYRHLRLSSHAAETHARVFALSSSILHTHMHVCGGELDIVLVRLSTGGNGTVWANYGSTDACCAFGE